MGLSFLWSLIRCASSSADAHPVSFCRNWLPPFISHMFVHRFGVHVQAVQPGSQRAEDHVWVHERIPTRAGEGAGVRGGRREEPCGLHPGTNISLIRSHYPRGWSLGLIYHINVITWSLQSGNAVWAAQLCSGSCSCLIVWRPWFKSQLCGVCMISLCVGVFFPGNPGSSHSQKSWFLG